MATHIKISGLASALLALMATGACREWVTTAECGPLYWWRRNDIRLRLYPTDTAATELAMDGCNLTEIDPDKLTGLPNLNTLDLSTNNIEKIDPAAFQTTAALTTLRLERNKLRKLVFDEGSCANLNVLGLRGNQLRVIDNAETFSACTKLQRIDLGSNGLEFIHPNLFSALTDLRTLILNNNKLTFVPDQLLVRNGNLTRLSLSNNRITHLSPDFATSRKRVGAGLEAFYFQGNPWHCACLLELLVDVKKAGAEYNDPWDSKSNFEGILPKCIFIGIYPCRRHAPSSLLQLAPHVGGR